MCDWLWYAKDVCISRIQFEIKLPINSTKHWLQLHSKFNYEINLSILAFMKRRFSQEENFELSIYLSDFCKRKILHNFCVSNL